MDFEKLGGTLALVATLSAGCAEPRRAEAPDTAKYTAQIENLLHEADANYPTEIIKTDDGMKTTDAIEGCVQHPVAIRFFDGGLVYSTQHELRKIGGQKDLHVFFACRTEDDAQKGSAKLHHVWASCQNPRQDVWESFRKDSTQPLPEVTCKTFSVPNGKQGPLIKEGFTLARK